MRCAAKLPALLLTLIVSFPLTLAGCRQPSPESLVVPLGDGLLLGEVIHTGNLAVWPVLTNEVPDIGPFRTLEQAQASGELAVRERERAEVRSLWIENKGDVPILACAGAVFVGGKQDRLLGEDVVIAGNSSIEVKTFCVEAGRWSGGSEFRVLDAKTTSAVRAAGQHDNNQTGVWRHVANARARMGVEGGTSYRDVANARQKRAHWVAKRLRTQSSKAHLVGYAYAINGRVMGMRTFAHPALLKPRLDAMLRAVCLESEQVPKSEPTLAVSEELQRMTLTMRMASDAYDDGDYDAAEAQAERALALDPDNETARELLRVARQSRYVGDDDKTRNECNDEWRTVMAKLENNVLPSTGLTGLGAGTAFDDSFVGSLANPSYSPPGIIPEPSSIGTGAEPGLFFNDGTDGEYRSRVENLFDFVFGFDNARPGVQSGGAALAPLDDVTGGFDDLAWPSQSFWDRISRLRPFRTERTTETKGINRNRYARTRTGKLATCSIRGRDGKWISLTRDWTGR